MLAKKDKHTSHGGEAGPTRGLDVASLNVNLRHLCLQIGNLRGDDVAAGVGWGAEAREQLKAGTRTSRN